MRRALATSPPCGSRSTTSHASRRQPDRRLAHDAAHPVRIGQRRGLDHDRQLATGISRREHLEHVRANHFGQHRGGNVHVHLGLSSIPVAIRSDQRSCGPQARLQCTLTARVAGVPFPASRRRAPRPPRHPALEVDPHPCPADHPAPDGHNGETEVDTVGDRGGKRRGRPGARPRHRRRDCPSTINFAC
jgi:hypothetical protein